MLINVYMNVWLILLSTALLWKCSRSTVNSDDFTSCYDYNGTAKRCEPPSRSFSLGMLPVVNSTCGINTTRFCIREYNLSDSSIISTDCSYECSPTNMHPPEDMTDFWPRIPETWWQSESGESKVSIKLSFNALVQIQTVLFRFVSFKPDSFYITKFQQQQPFHYFSVDCMSRYNITPKPDLTFENETEVLCQALTDPSPGQISFIPALDRPSSRDNIPGLSTSLYNFATASEIEIILDGYSMIEGLNQSDYFYALEELNVAGKCQCNGHANECTFGTNICVCQHNTTGVNCERCTDLYNDVPWEVTNGQQFECKACSCHGRASSCTFNSTLYQMTGSGGVCNNCTNHTQGIHCNECEAFYYPQLQLIDSTSYCKPCDCYSPGVIADVEDCSRNISNNQTLGQCNCKANVDGRTCDSCKNGYFNLSISNPNGCQDCGCHPNLSMSLSCNQTTGDCICKPNVMGAKCIACEDDHYFSDLYTCSPCNCNIGGSISASCDLYSGQCNCRTGIVGRTCSEVSSGYFFPYIDHYLFEAEFGSGLFTLSYRLQNSTDIFTGAGYALISDETELITMGTFIPPVSGLYEAVIRYSLSVNSSWNEAELRIDMGSEIGSGPPTICQEHTDSDRVIYRDWNSGMSQNTSYELCLRGGRSYSLVLNGFDPGPSGSSLEVDSMVVLLREGQGLVTLSNEVVKNQYSYCVDNFKGLYPLSVRDNFLRNCQDVSFAVFSEVFNGTLTCDCHPEGSYNPLSCTKYGGECSCKANVIGRTCSHCAGASYQLSSMGCSDCNCSPLGSQNIFCNNITGQCDCLHGVAERTCDFCADNYYNLTVGVGCSECHCNHNGSLSLQCNNDGSCNCKTGFNGITCDRCKETYYGFPLCQECNCSLAWSLSLSCDAQMGNCSCRSNTMGDKCQTCVEGAFNPQPTNPDGCQPCFCSELADSCTSAHGYISLPVTTNFTAVGPNGWGIINGTFNINNGLHVHANNTAYIVAPAEFLGNKLSSYGRYLRFNVSINGSLTPIGDFDIMIENSQGIELFARYYETPSLGPQTLTVFFHESAGWMWKDGMPVSANTLQSVLIDLTNMYLRVSLSHNSVELQSVSLESAAIGEGDQIGWVENCTCYSSNYTGLSCQFCSDGYSRLYDNTCQLCHCNGFSDSCDKYNGTCFDCSGNTTGKHCHECLEGFYGNPSAGVPCSPCLCPLEGPVGRYSNLCHLDEYGNINCTNCSEGHVGNQCQWCGPSFYGDPTGELSGNSTACTTCYCNGNIDLVDWSSCDNITGICLKCLFNTTGSQCQHCLDGYYGDPINTKNCSLCGCSDFGSNGTKCDVNGQCYCLSNVIGTKCDQCQADHYNFTSGLGCESCDCHVNGSTNSSCDDVTGNCTCKYAVIGKQCDQCEFGYYGLNDTGCTACNCSTFGSESMQCLHSNGSCICKEGSMGFKCDTCKENYYFDSSGCTSCPACYHDLKADVDRLRIHYQLTRADVNMVAERNDPTTSFKEKIIFGLELVQTLNDSVIELNNSQGQIYFNVRNIYDTITTVSNNLTSLKWKIRETQSTASTIITLSDSTEEVIYKIKSGLYVSLSLINHTIAVVLPNVMSYNSSISSNDKQGDNFRATVADHVAMLLNETNNITYYATDALAQSNLSLNLANLLTTVHTSNQWELFSLNSLVSLVNSLDVQAANNLTLLNLSILTNHMLLDMMYENLPSIPSDDYIKNLINDVQHLSRNAMTLFNQTQNQTYHLRILNETLIMFEEQYHSASKLLDSAIQSINWYYAQLNDSYIDALSANVSSQKCISSAEKILLELNNFYMTIFYLQSQSNATMQSVDIIQQMASSVIQSVSNANDQLKQVSDYLSQAKPLSEQIKILSSGLEKVTNDLVLNSSTLLSKLNVIYNESYWIINETKAICTAINSTLTDINQLDILVTQTNQILASTNVQELPYKANLLSTNATRSITELMSQLFSTQTPDIALITNVQTYLDNIESNAIAFNVTAMTEYFENELIVNTTPELSRLNSELSDIENEVIRLRKIMQTLPPNCSN